MMFQRWPKYVGDDDDDAAAADDDVDDNNNNILCMFKRITSAFLWTYISITLTSWDTRWRCWLRHCAISRKVAVSIPD